MDSCEWMPTEFPGFFGTYRVLVIVLEISVSKIVVGGLCGCIFESETVTNEALKRWKQATTPTKSTSGIGTIGYSFKALRREQRRILCVTWRKCD
jgi:hypothetical protein